MKIVVVGGGKMGLPLGCAFAMRGAEVTICDINPQIVADINTGRSPHDEPGLPEAVASLHAAGRLSASQNTTEATREAEAVVILVSALLTSDRDIDFGNLDAATEAVAAGLQPGTLVCYETTVPVGACRTRFANRLAIGSGLKCGAEDGFHLAFSPERVKSRLVFEKLLTTPKIVGGWNSEAATRAARFYGAWLGAQTTNVETLEAAEFVKLSGMIYRDANIAIANELAAYAEDHGLDFNLIREAANTDNETFLLLHGIGVGGHCTPVYPYFLIRASERAGKPQRFAALAREINEAQPRRQCERLAAAIGGLEGKKAHILGLAFRPQIAESSHSSAFAIHDALVSLGAGVTLDDPCFSDREIKAYGFEAASMAEAKPDVVILNTAHPEFLNPDFAQWREDGVSAVLDGRNVWSRAEALKAGLHWVAVGEPTGSPKR
ncbi:nucleotide sugar dehydrogenase [Magnetofaba australis]|uniref:Putative nucleotide sugar dehydrogenase n=1 Tax=Magnetofaba australis IT-1 TaxID=1434232 RepID=A0A1Y2K3A8_9PROT|nr:nucleotide sugar dehydrogenase [Magnetofaba australis]OSM02116.1 putative nucleotide sugar dehydrogenase [Magnetofaba australis IT-1]